MIIEAPIQRPFLAGDRLDLSRPLLWTVDGVLSAKACAALIARIEAAGPSAALITTPRGFEHRPEIRNNTRVMIDDAHLAEDLFRCIAPTLPATMNDGMQPVGANERFRCYRYTAGQRFAPHYDGAFIRNDEEQSLLTYMIYLNDDFDGGATDFLDLDLRIAPKPGRALLFQHCQLHEGCAVERGVKYVLRSDIMFRIA